MKTFGGKVLFLDRNDINTDEIIPAKYLTENSREALKPYVLEDLKLSGFDAGRDMAGKGAIVTRGNFGCGSSREHAPWALEANGINIVVGESFARIFRQNMYNCGMIACEAAPETLDEIFREFSGADTELEVDTERGELTFISGDRRRSVPFRLADFERALVEAGGWVEYAAQHY
ncbi:MAG: 3-isopropylmalate dehydratase small subunit [Spirochaetaceae bacterium]|jgi:3-isopropylmalate/(R)-2-methylmalate dehydratase small subunit|nr:3-isopropylmalate dehydratase small subunit [Spirochaetaceae bacterium]